MKIFKKNQLAILVISLMLITAGYLNYDSTMGQKTEEISAIPEESVDLASVGDAELVNANPTEETNSDVQNENNEEEAEENQEKLEETANEIKTNTLEANGKDYFATSKLERNIMYSQMIERYQQVLQSSNSIAEQKTIAQEEINKINDLQNAIMIAENLLGTKGFDKNIIFVNGDSISVIIGKEKLSPDEIAQVQNIISRELSAEVDNIHISLK